MNAQSIRLTGLISILLVLLFQAPALQAEGSWQMGLFEGLSHRQPINETSGTRNLLKVDILNVGEVINVHACGNSNGNVLRILIYDPNGVEVYRDQRIQNVDCEDDFTGTFDPAVTDPHQYVTTTTGTYTVFFSNRSSNRFNRFDITVTNDVDDLIDPKAPLGRVWATYWYFWAGAFTENRATDADLYVVANGGFTNTYTIWQLDLNNFAGYGYGLKANSLGVNSPNASGDEVAGMSVPKSGNSISEEYPIYLSYPAKNYPEPTQTFAVSELTFMDNEDQDNVITTGGDGSFQFTIDALQTGVYEIIIDTGSATGNVPDGLYGEGDVYLRGTAVQGLNNIPWTGNDNSGNPLPQGNYTAELSVRIGEFHFVADDVETSGGPGDIGIKMYKAGAGGSLTPVAVYWDKQTVLGDTSPNAFNQFGIYDGDHNWGAFNSGGVGNNTLLDTYSYAASVSPDPVNVTVVDENGPLITATKGFVPENIVVGEISTLELEIVNNDTINVTRIKMTDTFPQGMTLVSAPGDITVTGSGCTNFQFSAETVSGGTVLDIVDGEIAGGSTCLVTAEVTASQPGKLVNRTSGVTSPEKKFGVASNGAILNVDPEPSGAPLSCGATWYEIDIVGNETRLYELSNNESPVVRSEFSGPAYLLNPSYRYTGLAFSPQDNYLYAIVSDNDGSATAPVPGSIVRIDQDGKVVNLGRPEPGPNSMEMPLISDRFVGGTYTADGAYIVVTDNSATTHIGETIPAHERGLILEIDVSTNPPQLLFNRQHGRDVGDVVSHPNGTLYSHAATEGLIEIDSKTGAVVVIGGNVTSVLAGMTADKWGNVYGHTATDEYLQLDISNGNGALINSLVGSFALDSASCAYGITMEKTVSASEVKTGSSVVYTIAIANSLNSPVVVDFIDQLADSTYFVADTLVNTIGGTVNAYADTDTLSISGGTLAANSTSVMEFEVFYPAGMAAGTVYNQAMIQSPGFEVVLSDYPSTAQLGDATPIDVLTAGAIGSSKSASVSGREVNYLLTIENIGSEPLENVTLEDDLDVVFGSGNYHLAGLPVFVENPGTIQLNNSYTGSGTNTTLIAAVGGSSLEAGARAVIRMTVIVDTITDMGAGTGVYSNQASVTANAGAVNDLSVDGDDVDPNNDGVADEESATVVNIVDTFTVSGVVFQDNGESAIAHDGVQAGAEPPDAGVVVEIRLADGSVIESVTTTAGGRFYFEVPVTIAVGGVANLQVAAVSEPGYQWISERLSIGSAFAGTGSVTDGLVELTHLLSSGESYSVNFGRVKTPHWQSDHVAENGPDTVVFHPHQFRAFSDGELSFDYTTLDTAPQNASFSAVLFRDSNCDGSLDETDVKIPAAVSIETSANTEICVINKVFIPADVSHDDTYRTSITATLAYSDSVNSGHALSDTLTLTDLTRAIALGEGVLVLAKYVENKSEAGVATTRNSAQPDDVLRYTIDFHNGGTGPVSEVLVSDSTPAYSALELPVQCPSVLPDGIINCQVVVPPNASNSAGYQGPVQWLFDGNLNAGAAGTVWFEIRIE